MAATTPNFAFNLPTVGADTDVWGGDQGLNANWSSIDDLLLILQNAASPTGAIMLWFGTVASIPTGWNWCDGSLYDRDDGQGSIQSPDLRSRFLVGTTGDALGSYPQGGVGGGGGAQVLDVDVGDHSLAVAELPPHSHGAGSLAGPQHTHPGVLTVDGTGNVANAGTVFGEGITDAAGAGPVTGTTGSTGNGNAHTHNNSTVDLSTADLDPAWYALAYIIKL